jgi:hypothetical protein
MSHSDIISEKRPGSKGTTVTDGQTDGQIRLGAG